MSIRWVISLFRVACQYLCGGMAANVCVSSVWVRVSPTARPVVGQRVRVSPTARPVVGQRVRVSPTARPVVGQRVRVSPTARPVVGQRVRVSPTARPVVGQRVRVSPTARPVVGQRVRVSPTARPVVGQRVRDFIVHLRSYQHRVRGIHSSALVAVSVRNNITGRIERLVITDDWVPTFVYKQKKSFTVSVKECWVHTNVYRFTRR